MSIDQKEFEIQLKESGFKSFRAKQILQRIYNQKCIDFNSINNIPKNLIQHLNQNYTILSVEEAVRQQSISKETDKLLLKLNDGKKIECVVIRSGDRNTLCVSSQVGCPLGCVFCSTAQMGFIRNLTDDEILSQFLYVSSVIGKIDNIVFMGMGEPFLNYDNLIKAIRVLNNENAFNYGIRRITISTSGIVEGIKRLVKDKVHVTLAVSLNSAIDKKRSMLMPVNKSNKLKDLINALGYYQSETGKRFTFEYVMLEGVNMGKEDAEAILRLYDRINFNLNVIPYNPMKLQSIRPSENSLELKTPQEKDITKFLSYFKDSDIEIVKRYKKGDDISAACGQLATSNEYVE